MTIDISNLSPEKRAWLKANPDLLKSLEAEVPRQAASFKVRQEKVNRGNASWQRNLDGTNSKVEDAKQRAEELRRQYDPMLREINRRFIEEAERGKASLVCPVCGDIDHQNKVNGKSWCLKCNNPLVPKEKVETWKKFPKVRVVPKDLRRELKRLNPGLYPDVENE